MALTGKEVDEAWGIMGASSAGKNARLRLVECLNSICPNAANASALLLHEGRRTLARELLTLLDAGMKHGGLSNDDDRTGSGRAGIAVASAHPSRRRVSVPDPNG